jgi:hypothetical protein
MKNVSEGPLERLTKTNDIRIEEDLTRPRVEEFVDEYGAWVAYHRAKDHGDEFQQFFGIGWH